MSFARSWRLLFLGHHWRNTPFGARMSNGTSGNINHFDFTKPAEKRALLALAGAVQ